MVLLRCLLCKRERKLFKISMIYGRTGCPIKDYIVQILGPCEEYLHDDNGICSLCVCFLNNLLYIKKCMCLIISVGREENCNKPFLKFSHVYRHFIENLQKLNYEECESDVDQTIPELLRPDHCSPFEEEHEVENNLSYDVYNRIGTPYADREVQIAFGRRRGRVKGRRKRRGHNWSRRKNSRPKSNLTVYSEPIPRTNWTHLSTTNFSEYQSSDSDDENDEEVSGLENIDSYQNGILPNKRSRSVGEQQDEISIQISKKYKCILDCSSEFDSLDKLTDHKKEEHGMLAKYVCYECYAAKTFVSPEDLKLHDNLDHSILISNCFKCSMELRTKEDLQKHLREPHPYSCNYCDMFFVSPENYEKHIHAYHKGKKKIIKRCMQYTVVNRSYERDDAPIDVLKACNTYNGQIIWRLQRGLFVEKLSTLCLNVIMRFNQGTVDIPTLLKTTYDSITLNTGDNCSDVDLPNYTNENYLYIQNEVNIAETTNDDMTFINSSDGNGVDSGSIFETSEVVSNISKETNVYTSTEANVVDKIVTSNKTNEPGNNCILTTNDSFEKFMTNVDVTCNTRKPKSETLPKNIYELLSQNNKVNNTQENLNSNSKSNHYFNSTSEEL